ncbi:MAG: hypothetical protein WBA57_13960 [Elainellaceae cyanobacterium]
MISIFVLDSRANTPDQVPSESAEEPIQLDDSPEENLAGSPPETEATTQSGESLDETAIAPQSTEAPAAQSNSSSGSYHDTMMLGYRAYGQGDYQTALINFRRALEMQPGDQLANEAIENTEAAIAAN